MLYAWAEWFVLLAAAIGTLVLSGTASGAGSCGRTVLDDWFDNGRIDVLYALPCYGQAIAVIPADIRDYSDAEEVISRALQAATRGHLAPGGVDPSPGEALLNTAGQANLGARGGPEVAASSAADVQASDTSLPPIPALVLGGLSLVLLVAGGISHISQRRDTDHRK